MHASLAELLENLKPGLLWVARDGVVRYANAEGTARTGLATGRKLYDPDLLRAVTVAIGGRVPRQVTSVGVGAADGNGSNDLKCRVIPGLANDDAFVLISPDAAHDEGIGYDNLMQVIRTDLRDPVRKAEAALALAEGQGGMDAETTAVLDGLGDLLGVLDRLVDLASLWDSGALLANDRIELWPLLQQVWRDVEPMALQRSVKVRFRAQTEAGALATLYGSEHWLGRVFQECLEAAVRSTRHGGLLDIEHRQLGPRALIVFRDSGAFARREVIAASVPLSHGGKASPMPAPSDARERIGLQLCRHIVSLHGGQLREEEEDGLRNFLIELPTGAPHQNDQSQLDIAQAQRYALDLAALMTRARARGRTEAAAARAPAQAPLAR